ncbi:lactate utilization protein B [Paraferrimonas sedimenticola]|uniref:4Fe-4S ferredoxin n=1 Tax=Paraferrimonas sedimenticola TaxID=375674 RepID=A0AA37RWQ4_9GAMM|nr:lactate utilization protein B [Paraferrimonas sedimenticola]GLP97115.1 4Fe-4S ferredoxin [Paraferrimonas sedimenticola]
MALINGIESHASAAKRFNQDEARVDWHDKALWTLRQKRDLAAGACDDWEALKTLGSQIKMHTLANLPKYLEEFEQSCQSNGVIVHWASSAEEHNKIVHGILQKHQVKRLVKSKSMLTEECHLNPYLEARGIEVVDTDLGERICQLAEVPPSHIVVPAIHMKKEEVGELFHDKIGSEKGASCPDYLTYQARLHLREKFMQADAGLTGVNMAIADEGAVVICTNEGNADMGVNLPQLQIHCMGIDKLVPNKESAAVLTRMLARNATGQASTSYTSIYRKPKAGGEMHVVLVDNGRSELLKDETLAQAYKCIRCGGCLNTCPVYRRSGGHSYNALLPGPIGIAVQSGQDSTHSLPWACTLCNSCTHVCPTKVPLGEIIFKWRRIHSDGGNMPYGKKHYMPWVGRFMGSESSLSGGMKAARAALRILPNSLLKPMAGDYAKHRELPEAPKQGSFEQWFANNREG